MMVDGSSVGLILRIYLNAASGKSVTMARQLYIFVEFVVELMCTIYIHTYLRCFIPWTCPLANCNTFNPFEIIRQCYFVGNISRVKFHEWLLIREIRENFPP